MSTKQRPGDATVRATAIAARSQRRRDCNCDYAKEAQ